MFRRLTASFLAFLIAAWPALAAPPGATSVQATAGSGTSMGTLLDASGRNGAMVGICDGAVSPAFSNCLGILGSSAAASTSTPSAPVQMSPNGIGGATSTPMPVSPTTAQNTAANPFYVSPANSSYFTISATNGPNGNTNPVYFAQTDGTHGPVAVKAASTAAAAGDISEVVALSPNSPMTGFKDSGGTDMTNTSAHALNVSQPTASNLNVTAVPGGSAIFEVSPTTAANTANNPFFVTPATNSYFEISATNGANAVTNPIYAGIADGTNGPATVKAASTQSVAGDKSLVVQINPNQPNLTTALNVSSAPATATSWGIFTQGSTTSGQSGLLEQGAVTTSAPTYTNAQTWPLSLTPAGGLRTDMSSVAGTTISTGTGAQGSGTPRFTVATDIATIAGSAPGTAGSASSNVVSVQGEANMTAVTVTPSGNNIIHIQATNSLVSGTNGTNGTGSVQLVSPASSLSLYITAYYCWNSGATSSTVNLQNGSGGTTLATIGAPAGGGYVVANGVQPTIHTSSNTGLYYQPLSASTTIYCNASGYSGG